MTMADFVLMPAIVPHPCRRAPADVKTLCGAALGCIELMGGSSPARYTATGAQCAFELAIAY